jgi:hypothetical protein
VNEVVYVVCIREREGGVVQSERYVHLHWGIGSRSMGCSKVTKHIDVNQCVAKTNKQHYSSSFPRPLSSTQRQGLSQTEQTPNPNLYSGSNRRHLRSHVPGDCFCHTDARSFKTERLRIPVAPLFRLVSSHRPFPPKAHTESS